METIAIVPARSGSTGLVSKNVKLLSGHPLLAWSIKAGLSADLINDVYISTDSDDYAQIAKDYGGKAPFLRPQSLASDTSEDIDYVLHFLKILHEISNITPKYLVILRPTTPLRDPKIIDQAVARIKKSPEATALRSVEICPVIPEKCIHLSEDGYYRPVFESKNLIGVPRQNCPVAYAFNSYVDIINVDKLSKRGEDLYGNKALGFLIDEAVEIDSIKDWELVCKEIDNNQIKFDAHAL